MTNPIQESPKSEDHGFTLVELLVVVVIIGVLAGIAIPLFLSQKEKSVDAGIKSDLKTAVTVQATYYIDNGTYGTTTQLGSDLKESGDNVITVVAPDADGFCVQGTNTGAGSDWSFSSTDGAIVNTLC